MAELPPQWQAAFDGEARNGQSTLADPLPERRLARLLGGFIASGLFFLVVPGTLLGVWNLIGISARQNIGGVSQVWIQAHGHSQVFGWVGTFIFGIVLYTVPKFRGTRLRSVGAGWALLALWDAALVARWASGMWDWHWRAVLPLAAAGELAAALLLIWQLSAPRKPGRRREVWELLLPAGLVGLLLALALQLGAVLRLSEPVIPPHLDALLLYLALWTFCFPVAWAFSSRFLPSFLGLARPESIPAVAGISLLGLGAVLAAGSSMQGALTAALGAVLMAAWSLHIFERAQRPAKTIGVDPRYPFFVRVAFFWLMLSALLGIASASAGITGASRHAFTVGFLATLIFSIGPRILPSFLNSRELWSSRLMLVALVALTSGCALRVSSEPLAYAGLAPAAWALLPVSALIELSAVLLFALNLGMTLALPMPVWIESRTVDENLSVYWCLTAYPGTRRLLVRAGIATLGRVRRVPRTLTLGQAAEAEGIDSGLVLEVLRQYFENRLARALRRKAAPGAQPRSSDS